MYLEFLYDALSKSVGIAVKSDDPDRLRQALYKARKDAGDPQLEALAIIKSPLVADELWIIKKSDGET